MLITVAYYYKALINLTTRVNDSVKGKKMDYIGEGRGDSGEFVSTKKGSGPSTNGIVSIELALSLE